VSAIYPVAANIPPNQRQPNYDDRQTKSGGWVKKKRDHDPRIPEIAQTIRNKFDVFAPAKELNDPFDDLNKAEKFDHPRDKGS